MAESTEIMNLTQELSEQSTSMYCSLKGSAPEDQVRVFNATNNPEHKVADYINRDIVIKDVIAELIEVVKTDQNDEPVLDEYGEQVMETVPRVVLIDPEGEAYQAVSKGILNALKKAFGIFGAPTWEPGLIVTIKQVSVGRGNSMLTFDVKGFAE